MIKAPTIDASFWLAVSIRCWHSNRAPRARPLLPMNTMREAELLQRLKQPARTAGMPADKWSKTFRRRRMNDPLLVFNMAIFNVDDRWSRIFNPLKIHENGT
jgi:hypothetical protein